MIDPQMSVLYALVGLAGILVVKIVWDWLKNRGSPGIGVPDKPVPTNLCTEHSVKLATLERCQVTMKQEMTKVKVKQAATVKDLAKGSERFDKIFDTLTLIREDVAVLLDRSDGG